MTTLTYGTATQCHDADAAYAPEDGPQVCSGPLELTVSKSQETRVMRCAAHAAAYYARMDALETRLQADYPGYDIPGSMPPPWFDATYAGESWDEPD
jgi:hypothetical protein